MGRHTIVPPARLRGDVGDATTPLRGRHGAPVASAEGDVALIRVEIGQHAQEQALAGPGRSADGERLARRYDQIERAGDQAAQTGDTQRRFGQGRVHARLSCTDGIGGQGSAMTSYMDPRSGETFPLDIPRWCGTNGAPLMLSTLPGIRRRQIEAATRSLWRYRAALP